MTTYDSSDAARHGKVEPQGFKFRSIVEDCRDACLAIHDLLSGSPDHDEIQLRRKFESVAGKLAVPVADSCLPGFDLLLSRLLTLCVNHDGSEQLREAIKAEFHAFYDDEKCRQHLLATSDNASTIGSSCDASDYTGVSHEAITRLVKTVDVMAEYVGSAASAEECSKLASAAEATVCNAFSNLPQQIVSACVERFWDVVQERETEAFNAAVQYGFVNEYAA